MTTTNSEWEQYQAEAKEKWGTTDAYREQAERTKAYSAQKQKNLAAQMDGILAEFAVCREMGKPADCTEVQTLVKKLQDHITANYYRCTAEILSGLGRMYVSDDRFRKNIDKHATGTAELISDAIAVYCGE